MFFFSTQQNTYTSQNMFRSLLQPMTNNVFEKLVPNERSTSNRMNSTTCSSKIFISLHQINQKAYSFRLQKLQLILIDFKMRIFKISYHVRYYVPENRCLHPKSKDTCFQPKHFSFQY